MQTTSKLVVQLTLSPDYFQSLQDFSTNLMQAPHSQRCIDFTLANISIW